MRLKTRSLLLALLCSVASSMASADALVNVKSEVVRYDDIRLISIVGAAVLYGRLNSAVERACDGPLNGPQHLAKQKRYRDCVNETMAKAVSDVNHPVLTHYYESKRSAGDPARKAEKNVTASATTP